MELLLSAYWQEEDCRPGEAGKKNRILVTHFFVTDKGREPELSDSETTVHVGGLDNVDAGLFKGFDYVALGHIHTPQQIGEGPVWYAGSPLKYSFGEAARTKAALLVETGREGLKEVRKLELRPLREMRKVKGSLKEILAGAAGSGERKQDYIQAVLTDPGKLIDPMETVRSVYPNAMQIVREESGSPRLSGESGNRSRILAEKRDTLALFEAFYREVSDSALTDEGKKVLVDIVKELEG